MWSFWVLLSVVLLAFASAEHMAFSYKKQSTSTLFESLINRFGTAFDGENVLEASRVDSVLGTGLAFAFAVIVSLMLMCVFASAVVCFLSNAFNVTCAFFIRSPNQNRSP